MDTEKNNPSRATRLCASLSGRRMRGFTLLELMIVLVILALLATIAAPRVTKYLSKAKGETAKIQVEALSAAVDAFVLDIGRPPSQAEGLESLLTSPGNVAQWDGPYIKKSASLTDPWGRQYLYRHPGKNSDYDLYTLGADDKEGGEGEGRDVGNW